MTSTHRNQPRTRRDGRGTLIAAMMLGALAATPAGAQSDVHTDEPQPASPQATEELGMSVEEAFTDLDAMLFPPAELEVFAPIDENASCETIYAELNQRVPKTYSYRPRFSDNPWNSLIGALGTMWWPAWLLWIIPEYARYRDERHIRNNKDRVTYLRQLSAEKACWVKW